MNTLVIGGTSGLGLELAGSFLKQGKVAITGRHQPKNEDLIFHQFDLNSADLPKKIADFVKELPQINILIYAAGYYQEGRVTDLSQPEIEEMINVGGRALIYFVKELLAKQGSLDELITITSTSQWTPRKLEPIYNFAKAGAGHFTNSMAEDGRIQKVMVAGPAGMKTAFWNGIERDDLDQMLDPAWVAKAIMNARSGDYKYKYIRILRQPARVEEVEKR